MYDCPSDAEAERPRNFEEIVSGDETWRKYGIRIVRTEPELRSESGTSMGKPIALKVVVEAKKHPLLSPHCIFVSCWTPIPTADNQCHNWKEVFLPFIPARSTHPSSGEEVRRYVYESSIVPDVMDKWRVTFLLKWNHILIWANDFGQDIFVSAY